MMNISRAPHTTPIAATCRRMLFATAISLAFSAPAFAASTMDGGMKGMDHSNMPGMDHGAMKGMDHGSMKGMEADKPAAMDHGSMKGMDHSGMKEMQPSAPDRSMEPMGGMKMGPMQGGKPPPDARDPDAHAEGVRPHTLGGMDMADDDPHGRVLFDKLEYEGKATLRFEGQAWYGGDRNKLWLKLDGERKAGRLGATRTEALWNRTFATYWSTQLGVRHDFAEGPGRNWAALGVQGLAPYWFDIQATAYVGPSGRTAARAEVDYDLLITQRLILQPNVEMNAYGQDDRARGIGSGISDIEGGLRLRYEIRREFAPYIGVSWRRKIGNTADFARAAGESVQSTRFVAGVRIWF